VFKLLLLLLMLSERVSHCTAAAASCATLQSVSFASKKLPKE
jgi:hypothetical protein